MLARTFYRLAGLALLIGGVLSAIGSLVGSFTTDMTSSANMWSSLASIVGVILLLLGLPVLYGTFAKAAGALGLVGFVLLFTAGALLGIGGSVLGLLVIPWLAKVAPNLVNAPPTDAVQNYFLFGGVVELIGGLAFGAAILVARAPERMAAILLIIATFVSFSGQMSNVPHLGDLGTVLLTLALAWMGVSLMTQHAVEFAPRGDPQTAEGARA